MITKLDAKDIFVDWDAVEYATEVPRTYLVRTQDGREFYKMYKPHQAKIYFEATGWKGEIVSTLRRKQ